MHTVYIICGGLIVFLFLELLAKVRLLPIKSVFWVFAAVWFICAGINMYIGVSQAGYSVAQELPFFLIVYLLPLAIAWLLHYRIFYRQGKKAVKK